MQAAATQGRSRKVPERRIDRVNLNGQLRASGFGRAGRMIGPGKGQSATSQNQQNQQWRRGSGAGRGNRSHTLNGDCVDRIMGSSPGSISRRCRNHISELGADHAALKGACSGQWQRVSALPLWEEGARYALPFWEEGARIRPSLLGRGREDTPFPFGKRRGGFSCPWRAVPLIAPVAAPLAVLLVARTNPIRCADSLPPPCGKGLHGDFHGAKSQKSDHGKGRRKP